MSEQEMMLEAFAEFLNGVEAAVQSAKAFMKKVRVDGWDPTEINWETLNGPRGPYQRAQKQENADFKLMLKELEEHGDRLRKDGYFYWKFDTSATVGRKKVGTP